MKQISREMAGYMLQRGNQWIYLLYPDGKHCVALKQEDIDGHDYIFGFERHTTDIKTKYREVYKK